MRSALQIAGLGSTASAGQAPVVKNLLSTYGTTRCPCPAACRANPSALQPVRFGLCRARGDPAPSLFFATGHAAFSSQAKGRCEPITYTIRNSTFGSQTQSVGAHTRRMGLFTLRMGTEKPISISIDCGT